MDVSETTINALLEKGELRGHYVGRVRRVYVHSIQAYRDGRPIASKTVRKIQKRVRTHRADKAIAELREMGIDV